ncbi:diphosphomevalonate decarboxylase [Thoreauomyces humboldtii]|nr:diphosphomevalonate decarboxylase [Thoreauomyces humboldtii]
MTTVTARQSTVSAPVNIAVIKYWGKRDTSLYLPTNSSLSLTLEQDDLRSTTSVRIDPAFTTDRLWLNGTEEQVGGRTRKVIDALRALRRDQGGDDEELVEAGMHICSENNFPTAAGLASSASGFAALTVGVASALGLTTSPAHLSRLARQGSGSACRSLFGGYVAWEMGSELDGSDSLADQVAPASHWPLHALVLVASAARKHTPSTAGMQTTLVTSALFPARLAVVPERMKAMRSAIVARDYDAFAELTMRDSNTFHAVCLDSYPPISYLSDVSRAVIQLVTAYNNLFLTPGKDGLGSKGYRAAYTFDAGPNAVLYVRQEHVAEILAIVNAIFPPPTVDREAYLGKAQEYVGKEDENMVEDLLKRMDLQTLPIGSLQRIIATTVGDGPRILGSGGEVSLLAENGLPKRLA